jgi:predicted lipid-binding transport protein (Tim44 family)
MRYRRGARGQVLRQLRRRAQLTSRVPKGRGVFGVAAIGAADAAFSRAGGGGHSGSTHSSSTGHAASTTFGGGGGNGSFGGIIALIIVALIVWYFVRRIKTSSQSRANFGGASAAPASQDALAALGAAIGASVLARTGTAATTSGNMAWRPGLPAALDVIRAQDPDFELETFLQRAEMTFFLVKRGMQKNDPAAVRPYLNDAVFVAVSQYMGQMQGQHRHTLFESLNVRAVHLENADCSAQGQAIQVHFDLVYRLKTFDDSNHVVADEGGDGRHGERWTFARAAAARTPANGDVTASRCPACGAELRLNLDGTCSHCRASVTNGTVDWVVSDVQPAAFVGSSSESQLAVAAPSVPAGIATLGAADPNFSMETFKGRAKQAFLALQDAWCKQNLDAGRAFLSPGAYFAWSAQLEALAAEGRRNVMEHVAVQGIDIIRVVHGRVFDDLTVRVSAVAADFEVDKDNKIVFGDRTVQPFTEDWTFQRSIGVATTNKPGTLESTCPSCGAPVSLTQIGECRYCKAAVTSGKFDWVVSRIEQEDDRPSANGSSDDLGTDLALRVGGAIVGGLLGSILSGKSSNDSGSGEW